MQSLKSLTEFLLKIVQRDTHDYAPLQRRATAKQTLTTSKNSNEYRMQIWPTTRSSPGTCHENEAIEASVFCYDNASPEKSCFVDGLVCFISLCLRVFEFLNATRRE